MNRKSMVKASIFFVVSLFLIFLLVLPFFGSALVEETYFLGDKMRINLRGYGTYVMKITTPSKTPMPLPLIWILTVSGPF